MAIEVIAKVMEYDLPPREKYVLMLYANYSNPEGEGVWPSQSSISMVSGYSRKTINVVTDILEKGGLLISAGMTKYKTKNWNINVGWQGSRKEIEDIISSVTPPLQESVKTILQESVTPASHNTLKKPPKNHNGGFVESSLAQPPRVDFPPPIDDLLQIFAKKFGRVPKSQKEKKTWIAGGNEWKSIGVRPEHVAPMYDLAREKGLTITSPFSIKFAFDEIRNNQEDDPYKNVKVY